MKRFVLSFALIVGLLTSASTAMAQTVNMSRYITLTVTNGAAIKLDFQAAARYHRRHRLVRWQQSKYLYRYCRCFHYDYLRRPYGLRLQR